MKKIPGSLYKQFYEDDAFWYPGGKLTTATVWVDEEVLEINGVVCGEEEELPQINDEDLIKIVYGHVYGHDVSLKAFFSRWLKARERGYLVLSGKKESIDMLREEIKDRLKELKILIL